VRRQRRLPPHHPGTPDHTSSGFVRDEPAAAVRCGHRAAIPPAGSPSHPIARDPCVHGGHGRAPRRHRLLPLPASGRRAGHNARPRTPLPSGRRDRPRESGGFGPRPSGTKPAHTRGENLAQISDLSGRVVDGPPPLRRRPLLSGAERRQAASHPAATASCFQSSYATAAPTATYITAAVAA